MLKHFTSRGQILTERWRAGVGPAPMSESIIECRSCCLSVTFTAVAAQTASKRHSRVAIPVVVLITARRLTRDHPETLR